MTDFEQEAIPGLARYTHPPSTMEQLIEKDRPIAFGRVVMPYFFGLKEETYANIPTSHIEAADPRRLLLPYLLPATPGGDYTVDRVALSSAEYERIVRSPKVFIDKIGNRTRKARALDDNLERKADAATRSEMHALESKHDVMQRTLGGIIKEQGVIERLSKEARTPGYAHVRAKEMLQMAAYAHTVTFGRMLEVVGVQKQWSSQAAEAAKRAVNYRLFFDGNRRVGYWRDMLSAAEMYGAARERLFHGRIKEIGAALLTREVIVGEVT